MQVQLQQIAQGHLQSSWNISKDGDATVFLGNLAQSLTTLKVILFLYVELEFPIFQLVTFHHLLSCLCTPLQEALFHLPYTLLLGSCKQQ